MKNSSSVSMRMKEKMRKKDVFLLSYHKKLIFFPAKCEKTDGFTGYFYY